MKRVVFLGFGGRGSSFVQRFRELGMLGKDVACVGAYDLNVDYAKGCAGRVAVDIPIYSDAQKMAAELKPDAAIIASYDSAHLECFRWIQPLNIPVMVEKPLENTLEKAAEFVALAKRNTAPVLMAHNMRFAPILQRAKQLLEEGRIGRVNSFRFHNNVHYGHGYFRSWMRLRKHVGDLIVEKGSHDLDILHMLTGSRTVRIFSLSKRFEYGGDKPNDLRCSRCSEESRCRDALAKVYLNVTGDSLEGIEQAKNNLCVYAQEADIHDDDVCALQLENGAQGTYIQTLYTPYSYKSRIYTLVGSLGILEIDLDEFEGDLTIYPRYGSKKECTREHFDYHHRHHYNADLFLSRHFVEVIHGRARPACTVQDGYMAMATASSAGRSVDEGRMVDVPQSP